MISMNINIYDITIAHFETQEGRVDAAQRVVSHQIFVAPVVHFFNIDLSLATGELFSVPNPGTSGRECPGHAGRKHAPLGATSIRPGRCRARPSDGANAARFEARHRPRVSSSEAFG